MRNTGLPRIRPELLLRRQAQASLTQDENQIPSICFLILFCMKMLEAFNKFYFFEERCSTQEPSNSETFRKTKYSSQYTQTLCLLQMALRELQSLEKAFTLIGSLMETTQSTSGGIWGGERQRKLHKIWVGNVGECSPSHAACVSPFLWNSVAWLDKEILLKNYTFSIPIQWYCFG